MTNEEAISVLNDYDINFERNTAEEIAEAHEIAIEALKTQPCEDCVSRKDIGLTNLEILMCNGDYKEALKMLLDKIEKAPSVTPQPKTEGARGDIPLQQSVPKMPQPKKSHRLFT